MKSSLWMRADAIVRDIGCNESNDTQLYRRLGDLALLLQDFIEHQGLKDEGEIVETLEVGQEYDLVIKVKATVVSVSNAHGKSVEIELETRDYFSGRTVCVDVDEISQASRR